MIFRWLLRFLTSGILDKLLNYYTVKNTTDGQVAVATIQAEIETRKLQAEVIMNESGWAVSRWMRPFLFYPLAFHYVAVVFVSIFHIPWIIQKLPTPIDQHQGTILLSLFLTRPIEKVGRSLVDYLKSRN